MKTLLPTLTAIVALAPLASSAQEYTNFIRQINYPSGIIRDVSVEQTGEQQSELSIDNSGARFELWTVKSAPLTSYLLDQQYVGAYVPMAEVTIYTEDPYSLIPRTRADRPYWATIVVSGLLDGEEDPPASKQVRVTLHSQSYGEDGNGDNIDRNDATLRDQSYINANGTYNLTFNYRYLPSADSTKARGEERLSVYSLEDYQAPEDVLSSAFVQIWPVATASITGIEQNGLYKAKLPTVNINLDDLYPDTRVYAQVYPGEAQLGTEGEIVEGSALIINHSVPQDRVLTLQDWGDDLIEDGRWTLEVITITPFGTERLAHVTFDLDRTIQLNGSVTTIE